MITYLLSKFIVMVCGMLYPAYCSYKAVKTKDVKEYVYWMMYWIVFSIFSFFEVFVDTFIGCWFPFYYEIKIIFIVWMLSPATRGASILYRRMIHPSLTRHETEIDAYLAEFKIRTSSLLIQWGSRAFSYITELVMNTAYKAGAGDYRFMSKMSRAYSYENFGQPEMAMVRSNPTQREGDLSPGQVSDNDFVFGDQRQPVIRRNLHSSDSRYGSVNDNLGQFGGDMPRLYSMNSPDELDSQSQQAPTRRSSSRINKKEFGNYSVVSAQDMSMPLVFGWYPPTGMASSPLMSPRFQNQVHHQDFSQIPLHMHGNGRSELFFSPSSSSSVEWVESSESFVDAVEPSSNNEHPNPKQLVKTESDSDKYFDCDSDNEPLLKSDKSSNSNDGSSLKPKVKVVSKTVLQGFDGKNNPVTIRVKSEAKSAENTQKRNSMSAINKMSSRETKSPARQGTKVKKSLSNSDLKMVKAPVLSSSSFRRVFGLSSPTITKTRRTPSATSSTASLNVENNK